MIKLSCRFCGKQLDYKPEQMSFDIFFCSERCINAFNEKKQNVICTICGKPFFVTELRTEKMGSEEGNDFIHEYICSKQCYADWLKGISHSTEDAIITTRGFILIKKEDHPFKNKDGFVPLHRLLIEDHINFNFPNSPYLVSIENYAGLYLDPEVRVIHTDGNPLNNELNNLSCVDYSGDVSILNYSGQYQRDEEGNFVCIKGKQKKSYENPINLIKKRKQDAGLDIISNEDYIIEPQNSTVVSTDLFVSIPDNHVGLVWSRSGLSVKNSIEVGAGCIDATYRGEIKVHLYNHGTETFYGKKGDKIAQLLTIPINVNTYELVETLDDTERGETGFGSSGISIIDQKSC